MGAYTPGTVTITNIVDGCCDVYIDDTVDIYLGSTMESTKIENVREYNDIVTEQCTGAVDVILTNETCTVTGVLAENTLTNLKYLIGDGIDAGFGSNQAGPAKGFLVKTKGTASSTTRTYTIKKGIISTGTTIEMGKGKVNALPFTIKCLKVPTAPDGEQYWTVVEE